MSTEQADRPAEPGGEVAREGRGARPAPVEWWHSSHPTFAALTGFFTGMLFVTAVPGAFVAVARALFDDETAADLFPFVAVFLLVPLVLLTRRKTRRFGQFMVVGMVLTALVVLGVASLVLYYLVSTES